MGDFPGDPVVKHPPCNSIPGWGIAIPWTMAWPEKKKIGGKEATGAVETEGTSGSDRRKLELSSSLSY